MTDGKADEKPDPRAATESALAAVTSWSDQLHDMTFQAYVETRNSYGWSSLHAAIEIRHAAWRATRALSGGAPQQTVTARILQTVHAIRGAERSIKADMQFYDVRAMDRWPEVIERLDWQSRMLTHLADAPLGAPESRPAAAPEVAAPAPEAPPQERPADRDGQTSLF